MISDRAFWTIIWSSVLLICMMMGWGIGEAWHHVASGSFV